MWSVSNRLAALLMGELLNELVVPQEERASGDRIPSIADWGRGLWSSGSGLSPTLLPPSFV
jgi:hypothetical protein